MKSTTTKTGVVVMNRGNVDRRWRAPPRSSRLPTEWPFSGARPDRPVLRHRRHPARTHGHDLDVQGQDGWGFRRSVAQVTGLHATDNSIQGRPLRGIVARYNPGPRIRAAGRSILSQAVGKPVRVQSMRWDENGYSPFVPVERRRPHDRSRRHRQGRRVRLHVVHDAVQQQPDPCVGAAHRTFPPTPRASPRCRERVDASGVNSNNSPAPARGSRRSHRGISTPPTSPTAGSRARCLRACSISARCVHRPASSRLGVGVVHRRSGSCRRAGSVPRTVGNMTTQPLWLGGGCDRGGQDAPTGSRESPTRSSRPAT